MSFTRARVSRLVSSCPKDFDFQFFVFQDEGNYMMFYGTRRLLNWLRQLPEQGGWNALIAILWIAGVVVLMADVETDPIIFHITYTNMIDFIFNFCYAIHFIAMIYYDTLRILHQETKFKTMRIVGYIVDALTYFYYLVDDEVYFRYQIKLYGYFLRLHRPMKYLYDLIFTYLGATPLSTLLKYLFYFVVVNIFYAYLLNVTDQLLPLYKENKLMQEPPDWMKKLGTMYFVRAYIMACKLLVGFGMDYLKVTNNFQRAIIMTTSMSGAVLIFGISVTWLSLVIALYMRRSEVFRMRFRLISKEMEETHVPNAFCEKVLEFYRMYWHKQKAVSSSELLNKFPPSLNSAITTDIYFEAVQKSRVLRDLSYQFMSEVANIMYTINYVPGDIIVKRDRPKSLMFFITYGDIEVLTAEDDETPVLRFTRGTVINPCGTCMDVAGARAHVAVRAATFCIAHVLNTVDLWRMAAKYGRLNSQNFIMRSAFEEHMVRVKRHYKTRTRVDVRYKTSILLLKRNLIDLKAARDMNGRLLLGRDDKFTEIAGCYIMRNRGDTSLNDDSDAICLRPTFPCILQPSSSLLMSWEVAVSVLNFIVVLIYPYRMLFFKTISIEFRFFDVMVTVVYLLDIVVHLSTGVNIEEGVPITFTQTSADQVKTSWFIFDVISTIPFFTFMSGGYFSGLNKILKVPKIFVLLSKLDHLWLQQTYIVRFVMFILLMFFTVYMTVIIVQHSICFRSGYCRGINLNSERFYINGTLQDDPDIAFIQMHFHLYMLLSAFTFVHVPKIKNTISIRWRSQLMHITFIKLSLVIRILINAVLSASFMVAETFRDSFENSIITVSEFFAKNNVSPILKYRFLSYLNIDWYIDKAFFLTYRKDIFFDLPSHVLQDVLALQRIRFLLKIPITKYATKDERMIISSKAKTFFSPPNEILLNTGDMSTEVYVIKKGNCDVIDPETRKVVRVLGINGRFGELECLLKIPAYYTIKAATHVQVYAMSRTDLEQVLSMPKVKQVIKLIRHEALFMHVAKKRHSFLKYEMPPPPLNLERFPLLRKHEPDTAFLAPFQRLGFFSVLRYVFPRFTIRPDGRYLKRYEFLRMCCALVSALLFPIYTWLVLQFPILYYIAFLLDCAAYFDIVQRMLIAYFNEKGVLIYHPASTAANYVKGALLMDLAACFPFESLDSMRDNIYFSKGAYQQTKVSQFLRFNRILQLYRVPNTVELWFKDCTGRKDLILMAKAIPMCLALINVMASVIMEMSAKRFRPQEVEIGGKWIITQREIDGTHYSNWMNNSKGIDVRYDIISSPWSLFVTTYYWVVNTITTTGFQLALPSSDNQVVVFVWSMFIGFLVMTCLAVRVISLRANINKSLAAFKEHMKDLVFYMKRENIKKDLQKEAIAYYRYSWDKTGGIDYRQILNICTHISLKSDIINHIYGTTFGRCPILRHCEVSLLRSLGENVDSNYYREGMTIIQMSDIISKIYIIDFGTVELYTRDDILITKLPRGSAFGNFKHSRESLIRNKIVASDNVHLLEIASVDFYSIVADYPRVQELIDNHRPNQENYIIGSTGSSSKIVFTWKERAFSSAVLNVTKKGSLKFLNIQSKGFQLYFVAVSLACVFLDIYNAAFEVNTHSLILTLYILDCAFMLKLLLNFLIPYFAENGTEAKQILLTNRKRYYAEELKLDVLSCVPFEILFFIDTSQDRVTTFALLRLNRILRLFTVQKCLKIYFEKRGITILATFATAMMWFVTVMHVLACIWFKMALYHERIAPKGSELYDNNKKRICNEDYFCAIYFVLTTSMLAGVDDIMPQRHKAVLFVTCLMIFASMFFMICVGEFTYLIQSRVFGLFEFYSHKLECDEYLKNNRVAPTLKLLVKKYILYLWREQRGKQMPQFLLDAPHCLRLNIMSNAYMHHLEKHELFKRCATAFLRVLVGHFRLYTYMEGMLVVKEGEVTDCMYFIHKGTVKELSEDLEEDLRDFEIGHHFGTANGLTLGLAFTHSYKTVTKAQVLSLNLSDWEYLLDYFPFSREILFKKLDKDKDYDVYKVKEKKKTVISARSTRVFFESKDTPTDLQKLDSDVKSMSSKKQETIASIPSKNKMKNESATKQETEDNKDTSWPMFSRFSVAPGQRESGLQRLSEKKQGSKANIEVKQEKTVRKEKEMKKEISLKDQPEKDSLQKLDQIKIDGKGSKQKKTVKETSTVPLSTSVLPPSENRVPPKEIKKITSPSGTGSDKTRAFIKPTELELPRTTKSSTEEIELSTFHYDDELPSDRKSSEKRRQTDPKQDHEEKKTTESLKVQTVPPSSQVPKKKKSKVLAKQDRKSMESTKATKPVDSKAKPPSTQVKDDEKSQSVYKADPEIGGPKFKDERQKSEVQQDQKQDEKPEKTESFQVKTKPSPSIISGHKQSVAKLEFRDEVTTIDVPTKEEIKRTEDYTSGHRLSDFNLSLVDDYDEKDVEDYLDKTELQSESKESLESLESSISLAGDASSSWSVEKFMSHGKKKKARVSIADEVQSSVSLATINMSADSFSDANGPSDWNTDALNLDILDHRMLQNIPSETSFTSEISENYLTE